MFHSGVDDWCRPSISFMNNDYVGAHTVLYADDTTFINFSKGFDCLRFITGATLAEVSCWFNSNGFLLNEGKAQQIYFSLRDGLPSDDPNSVVFRYFY